MRLYKVLAFIFWIYRQYYIPNPFDVLGEKVEFAFGSVSLLVTPEIINWIVDPIIFWITYGVVGLYYESRTCPALGSALYMLFYCIHIVGIYFLMLLYPNTWLMGGLIILYVLIHIVILRIKYSVGIYIQR